MNCSELTTVLFTAYLICIIGISVTHTHTHTHTKTRARAPSCARTHMYTHARTHTQVYMWGGKTEKNIKKSQHSAFDKTFNVDAIKYNY